MMLIKMVDGGIVDYHDNSYCMSAGCPTCGYGSKYINEIDVRLTKCDIHVEINNMYEHALSEGHMMKIFLGEYDAIRNLTEKEFCRWLKAKLLEIVDEDVIDAFVVS